MRDECTKIKVYVTVNYDQFIFLKENRQVKGNTVINSINKKNLLIDNPILVSPALEVLDGQNRLEAARIKKVPIYYRIAHTTAREDISLLQNQKPWLIKDHAHFYSADDNYRFISEISEKYDLPLHFVISCCDSAKNVFCKFKNGNMKIKEDFGDLTEKFQKFAELIAIVKVLLNTVEEKSLIITQKFKRALWCFMKRKDYDHYRLAHAFNKHPDNLLELLAINSEKRISHGLDKRVFNYYRKGKRTSELD